MIVDRVTRQSNPRLFHTPDLKVRFDTECYFVLSCSELRPAVMADATEVAETPEPLEDPASSGDTLVEIKQSTASKKPPPESAHDIRVRTLVISSFWAIVIFLGLPIWWWTTSIHRSRLPLQEMLEWADGKVSLIQGHVLRS